MRRARRLILGVGNPLRGDDGVGPAVAAALSDRNLGGVEVVSSSGEASELMALWQGAELAVLVDAAAPAGRPGTLRRFDVTSRPLPAGSGAVSSHGLGPATAIELARALGRLPRRLIVYTVEADRCDTAEVLSPPVAAAVELVVRHILEEL